MLDELKKDVCVRSRSKSFFFLTFEQSQVSFSPFSKNFQNAAYLKN